MSNPLDPVMVWYEIALDSMRVAERVLEKELWAAVTLRHVFFREPAPVCRERLDVAKNQLADLVVLELVAVFERVLRDFVLQLPRHVLSGRDSVDEAVRREIQEDIEYWRLSDRLLSIFVGRVGAERVGQIKQVVGYRNWVAHGRRHPVPPDGYVTPVVAYRHLTEFLRSGGVIVQP